MQLECPREALSHGFFRYQAATDNSISATLEDWFDPQRVKQDYVPTGFKPYGAKTYAVEGHPLRA